VSESIKYAAGGNGGCRPAGGNAAKKRTKARATIAAVAKTARIIESMRRKPRFSSIPTATGGIARAAYARASEARLEVGPLLKSSNLTPHQIKNSGFRMPVRSQIRFLNVVADELPDPFLGIHLAERIDLREMGLLYYVIASSETLGDALRRLARYSSINNEGIRITCHESKGVTVKFDCVGVARLSDRHQIEFFVVTLLRICRQLTGLSLSPTSVKLAHRRTELPAGIKEAVWLQRSVRK
jgi:Arabinose-binding domain of AraC transcription regulator, N-term